MRKITYPMMTVIASGLLLTACDPNRNKTPLTGERKPLFMAETKITADPTAGAVSHWPQSVANSDWPQAGYHATHDIPHLSLGETLTPAWKAPAGTGTAGDQHLLSNLVSVDGLVFAADATGQISAIELSSGKVQWTHHVTPSGIETIVAGMCVDAAQLYATTHHGEVVAYDLKGNEIWRKNIQIPIHAAPTVKDGRVFVVTVNNEMMALDAKSGEILWTHLGTPEVTSIFGGAAPAVSGNTVIVAYSSGEIYALRADNGAPLWGETILSAIQAESAASIGHVRARPIIHNDRVYILSHGRRLVCLDLKNGHKHWQQDISGVRTPALIGDHLYVISNTQEIICLNRHHGKIVWSAPLPQPKVVKSTSIFGSSNSEKVNWSGPLAAGNSLILTGSNGQIAFLSPQSGEVQKHLTADSALYLSPIVVNQKLLVLTENASVMAWQG